MKRAFIFGIDGKMGKMLVESAESCGFVVSGGYDVAEDAARNVFNDFHKVDVDFDVIIDFSRPHPDVLKAITALATSKQAPAVIATTGFCAQGLKEIDELAKIVPVFRSANMSLGIAAAKAAALAAKAVLGDAFDIEIVEKHHNRKVDSPSGTALLLADALAPREKQVINRVGKRNRGELGITSVRGGGVVGEHEIGFYGEDETLTVTHTAMSRKLFAAGAFKAAEFLIGKAPGLYNMDDLVGAVLD